MANILTDWRQAVISHLASDLQGGAFEVRSGKRDGEVKDAPADKVGLVVVWIDELGEFATDVAWARPPMLVRAWIARSKQPKTKAPADPEPVEQLMIDLAISLQKVQVNLLPADQNFYFRLARVVPDYADWGVEATLTSWMRNPAVVTV